MSVTGGLDDDFRRPGNGTNKIKKNSIKRRAPNFNHDSDDAIVEPLLQMEREHSVIANKSAKYDKSRTDCLYKKDTKSSENPKASTPPNIANNVTNNIIPENPSSPAFISETAPIYNHLNVNILTGFDLEKLNIPTGKSIVIEIDGSKAVCHEPSPLIFTTAKIHTDTKKKVMELFQASPMPILSTIESDVVEAGDGHEDDKKHSILHSNKYDVTKNVGSKSDFKLEPSNFNEALTNETLSNSIQINNQQNIKKEMDAKDPFEKSAKIFSKDQKVSLKNSNANNVDPKSPIPKETSVNTVTTKAKPTIATATWKANGGVISDTSKKLIGTDARTITPDKNTITDKSKELGDNDNMKCNKISHPCASSSMQNNKSNINTAQSDKIDSIKNFATSSKKLQRQKNASIEEIKETNYKELNNINTGKNSAMLDKPKSTTLDIKSNNATPYKSTAMTTVTTKSSAPIVVSETPSKFLNSSVMNPSICNSSVITGTSAPINGKPITEPVKTKPAPTRIPEPCIKSAIKSPANITPIGTTATSDKTSITSTAKSVKVTNDKSSAKQDFTSVSVLPQKITKTAQPTTASVASTLPLYIVSTSKTKIGSSSIPSISTVTKKTLDQKPITEVVSTDGKSGKLLMSTSASQSSQSSSKPTITNVDLVKKDDRA